MAHHHNYSNRPENVLKHAEDLISINKNDQALTVLYDHLHASRNQAFQPAHQDAMKKFLELCVKSKNSRFAKEGLHQYRYLAIQHQSSLANVIDFMLLLAEGKAEEASETCDAAMLNSVDDLENERSPEAILLEVVSNDGGKKRNEFEHLIPWVCFLWESYRSVLELLRNNSKMEVCYHETANRAFAFCVKYQRTTEFHKLCESLRLHASKRKEEDITPESIELLLTTRFRQLKISATLRLRNDSFRILDDIHQMFLRSDKALSTQRWASYYRELSELFLTSKNYLLHSCAFNEYYKVNALDKSKSSSPERLQTMANCVLLSAMCIPLPGAKVGASIIHRDAQKQKSHRMAHLLGTEINADREANLQDLLDNDILENVSDSVRQLYILLERTRMPLDLVAKVMPLLKEIRESEGQELVCRYEEPLVQLLIVRVVSQLSQVFRSVAMSTMQQLFAPLEMRWIDVENSIVQALKFRQIKTTQGRLDHREGFIRFKENFMEEERTSQVLTDLSRGLNTICNQIKLPGQIEMEKRKRREKAEAVLKQLDATYNDVIKRKELIESRKKEHQRVLQGRLADDARRRKDLEQQKRDAEEARVARERELQEQRRLKADEEERHMLEWKQKLMNEGVNIDNSQMMSLSQEERERLLEESKKKIIQKTLDFERKMQFAARKLDAFVRIVREKEIPLRKTEYASLCEQEKKLSETQWQQSLKQSELEHKQGLVNKARYQHMQSTCSNFEDLLMSKWLEEAKAERKARWEELDRKLKLAKLDRARKTRQRRHREIQVRKDEEARVKREEEKRKEEERLANLQRAADAEGRGSLRKSQGESKEAPTGVYRPPRFNDRQLPSFDMDMKRRSPYGGGDRRERSDNRQDFGSWR